MTRLRLFIARLVDLEGIILEYDRENQRTVARLNDVLAQLRRYEAGERV